MTEDNNRKVSIPGRPVDVITLLTDVANNCVLAIRITGEVLVVFTSRVGRPAARIMSYEEATQFGHDIIEAHRSIQDDAMIARMEKEFGNGGH